MDDCGMNIQVYDQSLSFLLTSVYDSGSEKNLLLKSILIHRDNLKFNVFRI